MTMPSSTSPIWHACRQQGASLLVVLLILVIVSILGITGVQISTMAERNARNERDFQLAWQSSEAALLDAEYDIEGLGTTAGRSTLFTGGIPDEEHFPEGCGNSGNTRGLCRLAPAGTPPAWLTVDFTDTSTTAPTTAFGTFTGRSFTAGASGLQPAALPRYVIEAIEDQTSSTQSQSYVYRITAMGFGPNLNTQVVLQSIYRKGE